LENRYLINHGTVVWISEVVWYVFWIRISQAGQQGTKIGKESAPIQLAQCRFPGLAISNGKILIYFPNKIYGSSFIKQHSETVMVIEITKMLIAV